MSQKTEKLFLQGIVALGCLVPVIAGAEGVWCGVGFLGQGSADLDNHFRYLSGLLFAIGLGFLSTIPKIEIMQGRFRLLTFLVVIGGSGRLLGFILTAIPGPSMIFALGMELIVTPLLCFWQNSLARRWKSAP